MTSFAAAPFKIAHAAAADWAHAVKECSDRLAPLPTRANFGLVYITDDLAEDVPSILTYLRQRTGVANWVGSVGMGISANGAEYFGEPAMAAMVGALPEGSFRVFPSFAAGPHELSPEDRKWIGESGSAFGLVHGDPSNPRTASLVAELAELGPAFLVGGITSSRSACHQVAGRLTGGGVSGVLFSPEIEVATGLTQGCVPVGGNHLVSDCLDDIILGLDGRRALDVLREEAAPWLADDMGRAAGYIHIAFPIEGSDTGDYMVRNLAGIDPVRGWLAVGSTVDPGERMMFVRRDPESAHDDLKSMLEKLNGRLKRRPRGAVYVSCLARGPAMFGALGRESAMVADAMDGAPVIGFFAGGEISSSRLYTYTGVLSVFL